MISINIQDEKKFSFLFTAVKENMGFIPNSMKVMAKEPAFLGAFTVLSGILLGNPENAKPSLFLRLLGKNLLWSSRLMKRNDRVPLHIRNMVAYASSNASGCRYCQAHTITEAHHNGVSKEKLKEIWNFEKNDLYSEKERAAIRFGIAAGSVPNQVTEEHFVALRKHYTEKQIIELGAIISLFGFLNRWNDTFATALENKPKELASEILSSQGWNKGKH